ncbi:MAG TPA: hypothetical protein PKH65_02960 [Bacteroidia bacterium]|nr:hypothetical protein [Bacteroidia bacterium]HNT79616.1 hypothetical protein [Bacteroidia bacterium]
MNLYSIITFVHVAAGFIGLLSGLIAMLAKKGNKAHNISGLTYYYSMLISSLLAIGMTLIKLNVFLLLIGIFSLYMICTAKFAIEHWQAKSEKKPSAFKIHFANAVILTGLIMMGVAVYLFIQSNGIGFIFITFGIITAWMGLEDRIWYNKEEASKVKNKKWLIMHLGRMGGSYIAATTAFLVNNISFDPQFVVWLAPTAVGTILITRAANQWNKKLNLK